ncbi:MAG: hypothetical protein K5765_02750 [Clostridia bacterium]|nr:hypothetical protein [Clostridia bacterium]
MEWLVTIALSIMMMVGFFLMLWGAVGFIQNKKFFSSAPKEVQAAVKPKEERFKGQHVVGYCMLIFSFVLMIGAVVLGFYDGIVRGFGYWVFFARFVVMLVALKVFDILFFDFFLLCHSNFFSYYYPEVKPILDPHLFGYNKWTHIVHIVVFIAVSFLLAYIGILL